MKIKKSQGNSSPLICCFSSGKGGVGKTSIAVNLAASLARYDKKVLLIDGDLGLANVDIVLGLTVRHTIREMIEDDSPLTDILVKITPNFFVLPASSGVPEMANLSYEEQAFLTDAVEQITDGFDYVFVDTAAGLGESVLWFNKWAHKNIVVLTSDPTSMTDAYALIKVLKREYSKQNFHMLINNVKSRKEGQAVFENMKMVLMNFLKIEPLLLGIMPQDTHVVKAIRNRKPFVLDAADSKAGHAISKIAEAFIAQF